MPSLGDAGPWNGMESALLKAAEPPGPVLNSLTATVGRVASIGLLKRPGCNQFLQRHLVERNLMTTHKPSWLAEVARDQGLPEADRAGPRFHEGISEMCLVLGEDDSPGGLGMRNSRPADPKRCIERRSPLPQGSSPLPQVGRTELAHHGSTGCCPAQGAGLSDCSRFISSKQEKTGGYRPVRSSNRRLE